MKSSISRSAAWLFTTRKRTPTRSSPPLDDKTEAVIRELEAQHKEARRSLRRRRDRARVFVLRSGIPWQMLPQQFGWGSGMTCWRRLRDWQHAASLWDLVHFAMLDWLARHGQIE